MEHLPSFTWLNRCTNHKGCLLYSLLCYCVYVVSRVMMELLVLCGSFSWVSHLFTLALYGLSGPISSFCVDYCITCAALDCLSAGFTWNLND